MCGYTIQAQLTLVKQTFAPFCTPMNLGIRFPLYHMTRVPTLRYSRWLFQGEYFQINYSLTLTFALNNASNNAARCACARAMSSIIFACWYISGYLALGTLQKKNRNTHA